MKKKNRVNQIADFYQNIGNVLLYPKEAEGAHHILQAKL